MMVEMEEWCQKMLKQDSIKQNKMGVKKNSEVRLNMTAKNE